MNADGSAGIDTDLDVGAKAGFVAPTIWILLAAGTIVAAAATALIVGAATTGDRPAVSSATPELLGTLAPAAIPEPGPMTVSASLDPGLSRWQWLVKWLLAIPHWIVLAFLWLAFAVLTVVAGIAILVTGRYPRGIFDFNVGVLRWNWRVTYYAGSGGIGTDRYPPFSLHPEDDYPADLDVVYPLALNRWMVLVKWLLALPHLLIVALLTGTTVRWLAFDGDRVGFDPTGGGGVLGLLVLVAGVVLLFSGRYPPALFDLIVGLNRWVYRVVAYVALMTDTYPPFRLDQGGAEPTPSPTPPPVEPSAAERAIDEDRHGVTTS